MSAIKLQKKLGPVVFLGGINAMPMMYAIELRKNGIEVLYFVDRPVSDTLSRPENHFHDIKYPYPDWIVEIALPTQIVVPFFSEYFSALIERKIKKLTTKSPQLFILNGFFCSLSPFLNANTPKIFLSGGSDLDSWSDVEGSENLAKTFSKRSIFKYLPQQLSGFLIRRIVKKQFNGASNCSKVLYFPRGFNETGDRVLDKLEASGVDIVSRYDVSFEPLRYEERGVVKNNKKLVIFSGVRFLFKTFPDGNEGYCKGNDLIIKGLSLYYQKNKNIEIHFVEKGEDLASAKEMCTEYGLDSVVIWHKEMKFVDLLALYRSADVCFDQVGSHWIGAIGFYALWLGKPLIANDQRAVESRVWDLNSPILSASSVEQVLNHLIALESYEERLSFSKRSIIFADNYLGPIPVLNKLFEFSVEDKLLCTKF